MQYPFERTCPFVKGCSMTITALCILMVVNLAYGQLTGTTSSTDPYTEEIMEYDILITDDMKPMMEKFGLNETTLRDLFLGRLESGSNETIELRSNDTDEVLLLDFRDYTTPPSDSVTTSKSDPSIVTPPALSGRSAGTIGGPFGPIGTRPPTAPAATVSGRGDDSVSKPITREEYERRRAELEMRRQRLLEMEARLFGRPRVDPRRSSRFSPYGPNYFHRGPPPIPMFHRRRPRQHRSGVGQARGDSAPGIPQPEPTPRPPSASETGITGTSDIDIQPPISGFSPSAPGMVRQRFGRIRRPLRSSRYHRRPFMYHPTRFRRRYFHPHRRYPTFPRRRFIM